LSDLGEYREVDCLLDQYEVTVPEQENARYIQLLR